MLQWESQPKAPGFYFVRDPNKSEKEFTVERVCKLSDTSPLVVFKPYYDDGRRAPVLVDHLNLEWEGPLTPEGLDG